MDDGTPPGEFENVNEAVGAEWEGETTPYERVRRVIEHAYDPVSAEAVAEEARTAPKTARKHLNALASDGLVATESGDHGGTLYRRSPESLVVEQAAEILDRVSTDDLVARIREMRARLGEFQSEYGVESPEELAVDRTNHALRASDSESEGPDPETLREWKTLRRNLAFANAALSIGNAERFVDDDRRSGDDGVPV